MTELSVLASPAGPDSGPPPRRRWLLPVALTMAGGLLLGGSVVALVRHDQRAASTPPAAPAAVPAGATTDPLGADIVKQQQAVAATPRNYTAWASLGLDYVQQAKVTVDPSYYPKAEGALKASLKLDSTDNYVAMAGEAALNAAQHHFAASRTWAQRGLRIDPYNATLYGSLNDADTQLGLYQQAFDAARTMNRLQPGVPAFTRAEYVYELRGDIPAARSALNQALAQASAPADVAFVRYYLGELAFSQGDATTALAENEAGLRADPRYFASIEGKAKAEAALGRTAAALRDYAAVVAAVPQPEYVVEYGDYLQSLGRTAQAKQQYALFGVENRLFESNGVQLDTDPTLFYADHGRPAAALRFGKAGIKIRPFIEMDDAYAWALHATGRDAEALQWEHKAMALGTQNALFYFHAGMIDKSLGNRGAARTMLARALAINPHFSPLHAPVARRTLASL